LRWRMVRVYYGDHFEHPSTHEHLTTPETVAKFANLMLSFLLMMGGVACSVIGIWLASTANEYNYFITTNGLTPSVLLISYGIGLFFFSSVACCATARHSGFLLGVVVVTMFLLVCSEIVGMTYAFSYRDTFKTEVKNHSLELIAGYSSPGWEDNATEVFDRIQEDLECCGVSAGPVDWANASVNGTALATYWVDTGSHDVDAPDSCCQTNSTGCGVGMTGSSNGTLWEEGCVEALFDWFDEKMILFVAVICVILLFQIINVCGMYLWRRCIVHGF